MDEYDLNYYTYGLRLYRNMPLIEPMETKENLRIEELVIGCRYKLFDKRRTCQKVSQRDIYNIIGDRQLF